MNYNINFQVAAVIIIALLLYHFLTQKKLHKSNSETIIIYTCPERFIYLSDLLGYADNYELHSGR